MLFFSLGRSHVDFMVELWNVQRFSKILRIEVSPPLDTIANGDHNMYNTSHYNRFVCDIFKFPLSIRENTREVFLLRHCQHSLFVHLLVRFHGQNLAQVWTLCNKVRPLILFYIIAKGKHRIQTLVSPPRRNTPLNILHFHEYLLQSFTNTWKCNTLMISAGGVFWG